MLASRSRASMRTARGLTSPDGLHRSCEFLELTENSAQYIVAEMLRGYHKNGPHSRPYDKFTG